ncbi:hypothetical protein AMAG_15401 [Allomyces macrogynus ATCC 38327]|uniref:Uncharacterized protein n=1 Tax=Allomyces macrogynus (strain ATCC 38327) TaxID=578462 RepID=A0A0L0T7D2_ALLM3|nr:hypothetical protein AMAG_15401 [Allomyces macrogynus ATCC 38327]|eukprot:KNE70645.1 hypothetical protein AMAG_15401 [Allomyces macrogynus ATCC 38327]
MAATTSRASAPPSRAQTARIATPADPPRPAGTPPADLPVVDQLPVDHAAAPLPALATSCPVSRPLSGLAVNDTLYNDVPEVAPDPVPNSEPDPATITLSSANFLSSLADVTATALAPTLSDADLFPGYLFGPPEISPLVLATRAPLPPFVRARFPERTLSHDALRPLHTGKAAHALKAKRCAPPSAPAPTPAPPEPTSSTHAPPTFRARAKPAIQKRRAPAPTSRTAPPAPAPESDASRRAAALASLMASIQDMRAHKPPAPTRSKSPVPLSALTATPATPGLHRRLQSNQMFLHDSQVALEAKQMARDVRWAAIRANVATEFAALRTLPPVPAAPAAPLPPTQQPAKVDSGVLPDLDEDWTDPLVPASAIATVDVASIRQHYIPLPRRRAAPRTTAKVDPAALPDLATCPHLHVSLPPAPLTLTRRACTLSVANTGTKAVRVRVHPVDVVWADHVNVAPQVATLVTGQTLSARLNVVSIAESETVCAAVVVQVDDEQYAWRVNVEPDRFEPECSVEWVVPTLGPVGALVRVKNVGLKSGTVGACASHADVFAVEPESVAVEPHSKTEFRVFALTNGTLAWPADASIQLSSNGTVWHTVRVLATAPSTTPRPDPALTLSPPTHDLGLLPLTRAATHTFTLHNRKSHAVRFSAAATGTHARADPGSGFVQRLAAHPITVHLTGTVAGLFETTVTVRGNEVPPVAAKVGGAWYDPAFEARAAVDSWDSAEVGSEVRAVIRITNPSPVAVDAQVRAENAASGTVSRGTKTAELDPDEANISSDDEADESAPRADPHALHIPAHASAVTRIPIRVPSTPGAWRAAVTVTSRDHAVRIPLHGHATAPLVTITPHMLVLPPASASFRATGAFDLVWVAPKRIVHHDRRAATSHPVEATFEIGVPESTDTAAAAALRIYPIRGTVSEGGTARVHVFYSPPPPAPPTPAPPAAASPPPPADLAASRRLSLLPSAAKASGARRIVADTDAAAVSAAAAGAPAVQTRTDPVVRVPVRITPSAGGHGGKRAEVQWVTVTVASVSPAFTVSVSGGNAPTTGPLVIDVGAVPLGTTATARVNVISHLPRSPLDVHVRANPVGSVSLMHAVRAIAPLGKGTVILAVTPERDGAFTSPVEIHGASTRVRVEVRGVAYAPAIAVTAETRLGNIWAHEPLAAAIANVANGAAHAVPWTVSDTASGNGGAAVRAVPPITIPAKGTAQVMLDIPSTNSVPTGPCTHVVRVDVTGAAARELRGAKRGFDVWRLAVPGVQVAHVRAPAGAKVDTKRAPPAGSFTAAAAAQPDTGAGWALEPATATVEPGSSVDVRVVPPPLEWVEMVKDEDGGGAVYETPPMRDGPPSMEGAVVQVTMVGGFDVETRKMVPDTAPKVWEVHVVVEATADEEGED